MASFITTMFVPLQSSPAPQPLPPRCTLKQSSSCATINTYSTLNSLEPAYCCPSSPASRHLQDSFNTSVVNSSPSSNARTRGQFKPQRANKGTTSYQLRQFAEATLGSGSLRKAVKLPEGEDLNEWLAVNSGCQSSQNGWACSNPDFSCRFLQPDKPALWLDHRVLLAAVVPRNESDR